MRSAFKELTARQVKLDLCRKLVSSQDEQLSFVLEQLRFVFDKAAPLTQEEVTLQTLNPKP
jgi:hypothetical protein